MGRCCYLNMWRCWYLNKEVEENMGRCWYLNKEVE